MLTTFDRSTWSKSVLSAGLGWLKPLAMLMEKLLRAETVERFLQNQCWIYGTGRCCFKAGRRRHSIILMLDQSNTVGCGCG